MQFMLLMIPKGYESAKPGTVPDAERVAEMMKFNQALKDAGVLVTLNGLHPVLAGARVSFTGGSPSVIDGPFVDTKEVLGGYWVIRVKSKDEAIEWAKRCPATGNETIEIRQIQEMEDFPADVQKAAEGFTALQHAAAGQYVDGFVVPVPKAKVEDYRRVAANAGNVWREHGALAFVECLADDVKPGKLTSFPQAVNLEPDETVVFSYIVYPSRAERDRINALVMKDPRIDMDPAHMPFDGKRMIWGGFTFSSKRNGGSAMKYVCLGYIDQSLWDRVPETERNAVMDGCFAYDDELRRGGHFAGGEALQDPRNATTLRFRDGAVTVTDGPFAETKEQIGGILFLEARDLNEAIQLISRHPGVRVGPFEIRAVDDLGEMIRASEARRNEA